MSWPSPGWAATTRQTAAGTALHPFDWFQRFLVILPRRPGGYHGLSYALSYRSGEKLP
jgi:hypothetical protein